MTTKPVIRCAVYTRKSSDERLDQEFNSLDAQHESCCAFVASQRHEGWKLVSQRYDDGGISGGSLERPALQRLMADIDAGRIGMVVVYKIDRLTRSLADFAKLVERLDAAGASFVSVTQAFNTATSMGRLTLNVLLSFAQFEREVTAERIRDKIAASKKKGMWMGGVVPLGYDPHPDPTRRELVVNKDEAPQVETLFRFYDELGCLGRVAAEAARRDLRSKRHHYKSGRISGGARFTRGQLHHLLTNPVYCGQIRHKEKVWPGLHPAIISEELWDRVQTKLIAKSARRRGDAGPDGDPVACLTGKFRDATGDRLTPTHSQKSGKRHRYYVSNRLIAVGTDPSGLRLPAGALEDLVTTRVVAHLLEHAARHAILTDPDAALADELAVRVTEFAAAIRAAPERHLNTLIAAGQITRERISVSLDAGQLATALAVSAARLAPELCAIDAPLEMRRRGAGTKLVSGTMKPAPDKTIIRTLALAHRFAGLQRTGMSFAEIARREGKGESFVRSRAILAFLAPKIQARILEGTLPPDITLERLVRTNLPDDWAEQSQMLGL